MTEPRMGCAGKNVKTKAQLTNPPETLKVGGVHDPVFTSGEMNVTVNIVKDVFLVDLGHPTNLSED